ncbi:substrate-binding domain-containing protein [Streptomyces hygroscopicus subsp. hygroscopicus]|uniref:Molybdate transport system substrate-binding protein n=3 Tax=Streptomyces TaxID=1883 RepID=A0ABT9KRZ3_9ACTN|nr:MULTISPECIES: substrate-binding domain-containing protein [Streptomyces]MBW8086640.1 substrate-binding domain-containing protein [Streptomyces hygroscopicus subsp. hygroscopicus]MDP9611214.1 molybdate transport system substrate-binding protein [Streptomyces demainii]GHJ29638.1 molybdate ABC transporter substrate-binding protein [Streptomyces hygroscopicus]
MRKTPEHGHVVLFSTLAVRSALEHRLLEEFTEATGTAVRAVFDPTSVLRKRMASGEHPDVLIAITDDIGQLAAQGVVDGAARLPLASTGVGLAVRAGTPHPRIATVDELVRTLRDARSVAYSRTGASGIYFARLLDELGVAEEVNARATVVEKGFTADAVLDGRADLAIQQVSELMAVRGVDVVGPFPAGADHDTEFSAVPSTAAAGLRPALELVRFLASEQARSAYRAFGLKAATGNGTRAS